MTIGERLAQLEQRVEHLVGVAEETHELARATNGRVTQIERWRIDLDARQDERRKLSAKAAAGEARRAARRGLVSSSLTPLLCVVGGWALARFLGG